ncbi:MAG: GFA family protein [Steroidobacterales bacterium]
MKVEGQCHCGQLSFEAEIDPNATRICHCTDCQTMTGSAYRVNVTAPAATFILKTGQPKICVKIADSGARRAHAFCPDCGTQIYSAAALDPPTYALRVGTLKQRAELRPNTQIWFRSALPWVMDLRDVRQTARQ